ncbi:MULTISPECIES: hypothetical protein [Rhizobium]|nr:MULTISPECIES: hypothetical protein [Rhizobium]MCS0460332.1 hypothetical protein [Rhizobium favelukesii]UFS80863.1 hypothetical protein LPB79_21160 [Rhizobium sp. T136]
MAGVELSNQFGDLITLTSRNLPALLVLPDLTLLGGNHRRLCQPILQQISQTLLENIIATIVAGCAKFFFEKAKKLHATGAFADYYIGDRGAAIE